MSDETRHWLADIQQSLNEGFRMRTDWPDIAPLLFVTSWANQQRAPMLIVEDRVQVDGTEYHKDDMKKVSACANDFQSAMNICAKQINDHLLTVLTEGKPWIVLAVPFGQVQWLSWCNPERMIVDPHTGISFEVDIENAENHCVTTRGMVIQLNQPEDVDRAFIKNTELAQSPTLAE